MSGTHHSRMNAQIANVERAGFWLLTPEGEYFVAFTDYPDFRNATIAQIHNFQTRPDGFHWPDLDVEIELDALKHPDRFPRRFER